MKFFVLYGGGAEWFVCTADDTQHAAEQCWDYTDGDSIHGVWMGTQDDSWIHFLVPSKNTDEVAVQFPTTWTK